MAFKQSLLSFSLTQFKEMSVTFSVYNCDEALSAFVVQQNSIDFGNRTVVPLPNKKAVYKKAFLTLKSHLEGLAIIVLCEEGKQSAVPGHSP